MKKINIAIDGPASAGKSTIARLLAQKLNYTYLDTGSMYRALTYLALQQGIDLAHDQQLVELFSKMKISWQQDLKHDRQLIFIDGKDVTDLIRSNEVTNQVSQVASHFIVREELVKIQQEYGKNKGVVMDGRDIGTVVLPQAEVKIFLVASVEERAKRRFLENQEKGIASDLEALKKEIEQRDDLDSNRQVSPLKPASDSILVDTTNVDIKHVLAKIEQIALAKINAE